MSPRAHAAALTSPYPPPAETAPPALSEATDAEVVSAIALREQDALAELYCRYSSSLFALTRRVLRHPDDAAEVLQEVFLHVWRRAARYDPDRAAVSTWLSLITRSRAIDRLRSRQSQERTLAGARMERPPTHASPQGANCVLDEERRQRLRQALAALPEAQRQVLEMAFYEGLSHSQIARHAGIPLGTVKTRTVLGMKKLRRALASERHELL